MDSFITHAPLIGLVFFFSVFLWIAYRTYRPGVKQQMRSYAHIPLQEEQSHE